MRQLNRLAIRQHFHVNLARCDEGFRSPDEGGITFAQFFSTAPLTGVTDYPVAFAAAGTTTAVGGALSALGPK